MRVDAESHAKREAEKSQEVRQHNMQPIGVCVVGWGCKGMGLEGKRSESARSDDKGRAEKMPGEKRREGTRR